MQTGSHFHSFSEPVQKHWTQHPGGETKGTEGYEHTHLGSTGPGPASGWLPPGETGTLLGQTGSYERALRGDTTFQPMRHDTLRGMQEWVSPGVLAVLGLGAWAVFQKGIKFDDKVMMTGVTFLAGWVVGGIARQM
jgi:hypothetical protein